jgi:catechol 2,3-dioxygenase-like lactoylglutathione lyase family enzyme
MKAEYLFAGIPVADRDAAVAWYEGALGREPDLIPNADEACWQLTDSGWIYVIADPDRAGTALNTILVADLTGLVAGFERLGLGPSPIDTSIPGMLTSVLTDPDGNRIQFAQQVG